MMGQKPMKPARFRKTGKMEIKQGRERMRERETLERERAWRERERERVSEGAKQTTTVSLPREEKA